MRRILLIFVLFTSISVFSANENFQFSESGCKVALKNDTFSIENTLIKRIWKWNNGNLISLSLENKKSGNNWKTNSRQVDLFLPSETTSAANSTIKTELIPDSYQFVKHVRTTIEYSLGNLQIRKILKIYPDCPAIATEIFYKGKASKTWFGTFANAVDLKNIENLTKTTETGKLPVMERLYLEGKHWKVKAVEFYDITDRFNTLVFPVNVNSYKEDLVLKGNLLFAENMESGDGFFIQKEAPNSNSQLHFPAGDFVINAANFRVIGLGVDSCDIQTDQWIKGYGYITGVYKGNETERDLALRNYQQRIRPLIAERDEMIMSNTWGDRAKDTRVNEAFCMKEIESAATMGITRFQIDDGWQAGKSANSAYGGTFNNIWNNPDYWKPDTKKFPNGFKPLLKLAKELGVEICLWYNPSIQDNYAAWEKDADLLIGLYKEFGIRTFKIDGTNIPNKIAENNLRKLYNKVMAASDWKVTLNLDATAMRRGGYFYFNEYGNFFLENRYTDWGNYYPYCTLRNLWMLSAYMPPQNLQIEFLNNWRNADKYPKNDRFAPANYSFDYLFAITMMAQPLAWMETQNLPQEAMPTASLIKKYREIQSDLHKGAILPIGNEPNGKSWTGFQSILKNSGYMLIFRENTNDTTTTITTRLTSGKTVVLTPVLGDGKTMESMVGHMGKINPILLKPNSFVLYKYKYK